MSVVGLVISLALWNWLGGLLASVVPLAPFAWRALKRAEATGAEGDARSYLRWVAANHLWNHLVTATGSLLIALGSIEEGVPAWVAWAIFGVYFLFMRLTHIIDAIVRLVRADSMPAASNM